MGRYEDLLNPSFIWWINTFRMIEILCFLHAYVFA